MLENTAKSLQTNKMKLLCLDCFCDAFPVVRLCVSCLFVLPFIGLGEWGQASLTYYNLAAYCQTIKSLSSLIDWQAMCMQFINCKQFFFQLRQLL